jgi:CubicO group peptidase (beta-lactamase class C family)
MNIQISVFLLLSTSIMFSQTIQNDLETVFKQNKLMGLTVQTFTGIKSASYNFGMQNEVTQIPLSDKTNFRIASISKSFAALGLMKLYDQKKFKLDDDISNYLGFKVRNPKFLKSKITFRMLLSHTSSLVDGTGYDTFLAETFSQNPIPNIASILLPKGTNYTEDMWMNHKPGSFFTYCNLNYGLIGTLVEKISQQRFDIFLKKEILEPLGTSASFNLDQISLPTLATLYRSENNAWKPEKDDYSITKPNPTDVSSYQIGNNAVFFGPQGGLRASAADLLLFLKFLKSDGKSVPNLISKSTLRKMKKAQWCFDYENGDNYNGFFKQYGLGLHQTNKNTSDLVSNPKVFGSFIGHEGDAYGLISDAYFSEKEDFGFVIITNGSFDPFVKGKKSSFYDFEEAIFKIVCDDYLKTKK